MFEWLQGVDRQPLSTNFNHQQQSSLITYSKRMKTKRYYQWMFGGSGSAAGLRALLISFAAVVCMVAASCGSEEEEKLQDLPANASSIDKERADKDRFFKSDTASPLPREMRAAFTGLSYFPFDEKYAVIASFEAAEKPDTVRVPASQGEFRSMIRAGVFSFSFGDNERVYEVTGYKQLGENSRQITIPFKDKTSGNSTYGAGRYLDVDEPGEECTLDFNKAYSPYCAYNESYSCLLVPPQNILTVAINAGEKIYRSSAKESR